MNLMGLIGVMGLLAISILAFLAFIAFVHFTAKLIGRVARLAYMRLFRKPPVQEVASTSFLVLWVALFIGIPLQAGEWYQVRLYRNAIPTKLQIEHLSFHDEQSDLREGCGVAIFQLSDTTLSDIRRQGLGYFSDATLGRDGKDYHQYAPWQQWTPAQRERPELLRGWHCLDDDHSPALLEDVNKAVKSGEAFYTTGSEMDLIVVPRLKVLVFSHNG